MPYIANLVAACVESCVYYIYIILTLLTGMFTPATTNNFYFKLHLNCWWW